MSPARTPVLVLIPARVDSPRGTVTIANARFRYIPVTEPLVTTL